LELTGVANEATRPLLRKLMRKLLRHTRSLGAVPLAPLLRVGLPGQGFHTGGSFPMRDRPGAFETDVLGRVAGLARIHAVDATVFPTIPATTITLTAMANAHRIGSAAPAS
jgi:choline dehydrogenase-like flavoprotein